MSSLAESLEVIKQRWITSGVYQAQTREERDRLLQQFYKTEAFRRLNNLQKCNNSIEMQSLVVEYCSRDILAWVSDWVWTYDPRIPAYIPLIPFPKQAEYLLWRIERRSLRQNGVIEKSRDAGISWLNICHQAHCWLFEESFKGGFGSRKEELVDRLGDPDSLFEKFRMLLRYLPPWMMPDGFDWVTHDNFRRIINPANGSAITGEAGFNIGRGGRNSYYDLDEAGFIERPQMADAALSNNTDVIFYTSSANGIGNLFYQKRSTYPPDCVFRFHWKDDPRKCNEWYQGMKSKYDPVTVASEIDIDYGASVEGIYIPSQWVLSAVIQDGDDLTNKGDIVAALDVATTGKNLNVFGVRVGSVVTYIESWGNTDTTQTGFKVLEKGKDMKISRLNFDGDGVGSGVSGTLASVECPFDYQSLHGAGTPSENVWEGENRTSRDKFANLRAECWGILHWRFKNQFDHVNGTRSHPLDDRILIPNNSQLINQLSMPKRKFTSRGKTLIESKEDMRKRGLDSPDFADMLAYLFAPDLSKKILSPEALFR